MGAGVVSPFLYPLVSLAGTLTSTEDDSIEVDEDGEVNNSLVGVCCRFK